MKTVILCGGQGTRLREETEFRPKPMVEIGGKPVLWHIMKLYAHYGFSDFTLCLGYRGNMIKEYFLNYEAMNNDFTICLGQKTKTLFTSSHQEQDFRVTLADTGPETMTGGRIKRIQKYADGETLLATYGDGLSNINLDALLAFHKSHGKIATITTVRPYSRFGILQTEASGKVLEFQEKPLLDGWANAGYMVFENKIFEYLGGDDCILEREPLERLAAENQLMAFHHEGFFYAMDTYREYLYLTEQWNSGKAPWKIWE